MANANIPRGFWPVRPIGREGRVVNCAVKTAENIKPGDPVRMVDRKVEVAAATDKAVFGVAGQESVAAVPATIPVYPARDWIFGGQCSGTYAPASHDQLRVDIEGTTGIFEVNENAVVEGTVQILRLLGQPDNIAGLNANVEFIFTLAQGDGEDDTLVYALAAGLGGAGTFKLPSASPVDGTLELFTWTQDTATTGSDGSNLWVLTGADGAGNDQGFSHDTNADGEIAANTPLTFVPSTNVTVTKGEILLAVMTETGTATDLSAVNCIGMWDIRIA